MRVLRLLDLLPSNGINAGIVSYTNRQASAGLSFVCDASSKGTLVASTRKKMFQTRRKPGSGRKSGSKCHHSPLFPTFSNQFARKECRMLGAYTIVLLSKSRFPVWVNTGTKAQEFSAPPTKSRCGFRKNSETQDSKTNSICDMCLLSVLLRF